ncbi:MAG: hypothetical protein WC730_02525 [Patescibacteria group bacterium]|jgi:hypothetical protein
MVRGGSRKKAHIVAVNMGYGHERPAFALRHLATKEKIHIANDYPGIPSRDRQFWETSRRWYERVSRAKRIPIIGESIFKMMDEMQSIPEFYPRRDLSHSNLQLREFYHLIRHQHFMKHLIEKLAADPKPMISTFMVPAFAAEEFGYPEDIYVVVTDADMSRTWAPLRPMRTRINYLAPNGRVVERLKLYGVPEQNIMLSGFPLPDEAIGGEGTPRIREDLGRRLCNLDPNGNFIHAHLPVLRETFGHRFAEDLKRRCTPHPVAITFAVGGAGAQRELGIEVTKSLSRLIKEGRVVVNLVAGTRPEVANYFEKELRRISCGAALRAGGVNIILEKDRASYFKAFTSLIRTTDILWTKPSELCFYTGLGVPIIMAPPIGSQEKFNHKWLEEVGGGVSMLDPRYTDEWLMDWIESGALARMAWYGFLEAPKFGTYRIEEIIKGERPLIHDLPLAV